MVTMDLTMGLQVTASFTFKSQDTNQKNQKIIKDARTSFIFVLRIL